MLLIPFGALAQPPDDSDARRVHALEDALSRALVERDRAALERLWHDDLIFIARNGSRWTKAERLANLDTAGARRSGETNTNDEVIVRIEGDTAIATVASTWTTPTSTASVGSRYMALHVWTRAGGSWRLLAAQVASVAD
jgi:ketosteroid isomerase-like protein